MNLKRQEAITAYTFMLPFLVSLVVFFGYAFIRVIYFSFTDYNLFNDPSLVGVKNYLEIPSSELFRIALANTLVFSLIVTTLQTFGALLLAVVLNQKLRGLAFFRTAYYMPSIASSAVITLVFIWLFRSTGIISYIGNQINNYGLVILAFLGLTVLFQAIQVSFERARKLPAGPFDPALLVVSLLVAGVITFILASMQIVPIGNVSPAPLNWISSRERFLGLIPYPLLIIIIQNTFTTIPTLMLFFLAGLQNVSLSLYEAASIDGATPYQQLRFITVPMLRPVTFFALTSSLIGTLQMFDQVALFEGAAPLESTITLAYFIYNKVLGTGQSEVGVASAAAIILALLTLLVVQIQRRFFVSDEAAG